MQIFSFFILNSGPFFLSFFFLFFLTLTEELKLTPKPCWLTKWDIFMDKCIYVNFWKIWTLKIIILKKYIGFFISFQASLHWEERQQQQNLFEGTAKSLIAKDLLGSAYVAWITCFVQVFLGQKNLKMIYGL